MCGLIRLMLAAGMGARREQNLYLVAPGDVSPVPDPDSVMVGVADEPKDAADPDRRIWVKLASPMCIQDDDLFVRPPKLQPWKAL